MGKKDKKQDKTREEGNTDHTAVDVCTSKMKSAKRKRDSGLDTSLDASETYKENVETGSKKRKKESSNNLAEKEITDFTSETQPAKKSKKDKKKKKTASTLGVVDVDILQQAEVNFQVQITDYNANCNDEEPVKKKKHSKKTKTVSFEEPAEATDLPSKKKKHKKSKGQDLMSEEVCDKNESEQPRKKRKHTEIEAEIAPSEELIEDNENETEQSTTKTKKHKEKKSKTVSPEKLTETNGDESEQPKKKKKKHKEQRAEEASSEDLKQDNENVQPTKKKKKRKDKTPAVTPSKEGDDMNRNERALQYLKLWQSSRSAWKFNKMMQVHLLHVMYDTSLVMDEDFQILLMYLDGLKGKGREKTMEDARKVLDNVETEGNAGKEDRARQLYQMLA